MFDLFLREFTEPQPECHHPGQGGGEKFWLQGEQTVLGEIQVLVGLKEIE